MKKIAVHIQDKHTLVLDEDASRGDLIDLRELMHFDSTGIEKAILAGQDQVYEKQKEELNKIHLLEQENLKKKLINDYQEAYNKMQNALELEKENSKHALEKAHFEFEQYKLSVEEQKKKLELEIKAQFSEQLALEKSKIESLNYEQKILKQESDKKDIFWQQKMELEILRISNEFEQKKLKNQLDYQNKLNELENQIQMLQRQKASLNVKQTGEDLEAWCNNEVLSYMQNGLQQCRWYKDNDVVKNEGEGKGSKADFIFEIYASSRHLKEELLTSVCLDMKDENPDSKQRQTNEHYYKALDNNRNKKNCKYAVLVSNLELDKSNASPIYKAQDYEDMYVVRPAYLMTFLNMITSLTTHFQELVLRDYQQQLDIKDKKELLIEFEELKKTYLEKPLEGLRKDIDSIVSSNEAIMKASKKIDDSCQHITKQYLNEIEKKLSNFERKVH